MGTLNRTGYKYVGHFDITPKNSVVSRLDQLIARDTFNSERPIGRGGWVNGVKAQRSSDGGGNKCIGW